MVAKRNINMNTYKVEYNAVGPYSGTLEVHANSEQEAIEKAMLIVRKRLSTPDGFYATADKFKVTETKIAGH
jgi:hypothetical protein